MGFHGSIGVASAHVHVSHRVDRDQRFILVVRFKCRALERETATPHSARSVKLRALMRAPVLLCELEVCC